MKENLLNGTKLTVAEKDGGGTMTMPDTEDYIVFDRTGTPHVVVAVDIVNAYAEEAKALLRSPDPYTERVDVAPGFDSIRPEKRAENKTTEHGLTKRELIILSAYTGYMLLPNGEFGLIAEASEEAIGRPIMTHEFADPNIQKAIREKLKPEIYKIIERVFGYVDFEEVEG